MDGRRGETLREVEIDPMADVLLSMLLALAVDGLRGRIGQEMAEPISDGRRRGEKAPPEGGEQGAGGAGDGRLLGETVDGHQVFEDAGHDTGRCRRCREMREEAAQRRRAASEPAELHRQQARERAEHAGAAEASGVRRAEALWAEDEERAYKAHRLARQRHRREGELLDVWEAAWAVYKHRGPEPGLSPFIRQQRAAAREDARQFLETALERSKEAAVNCPPGHLWGTLARLRGYLGAVGDTEQGRPGLRATLIDLGVVAEARDKRDADAER